MPRVTATRATLLAGALATVVIAGVENWRFAGLALAAAGALAITRVRFAVQASVLLLVVVATASFAGSGAATDDRSTTPTVEKRAKKDEKAAGKDERRDRRGARD